MAVYTERYQEIIDCYLEEMKEADQKRKPMSGLFGIGQRAGDEPCHENMDKRVAELTAEAAEGQPREITDLVKAVLQAESSRKWPDVAKWAVLATQRHTLPLIPKMDPADRKAVAEWFEKTYPRRLRLPIQKQIVTVLRKA